MAVSSKRAGYLARASLALTIVFFVITLLIGRWSGLFAVSAVSWLTLAAVLIWFVLCIQFHQRALAEQEKLDTAQLAKDEKASTIFRAEGERTTLFAVAQRRLQILEKWFLPFFSAAIAAYQLAIGLYLLKTIPASSDIEPKQPLLVAVCMMAIAFVSFLMSRYATGMSAQPRWKPLRAGGSITLAVSVLSFALAIALALAQFNYLIFLTVLRYFVPILLIVVGAETALNVVLDIYRPRIKGQYARSAFDSRLLGLISEPGGILRTAATAIDYQFGFKVSQTWFYKLLEKAIVPLVLFAAVTLYLLSCIVIVAPNEEAIIERFGNPLNNDNQVRLVGPGLTFKWPWPIDIAYKPYMDVKEQIVRPTKKVMELNIGFVPKTDPETGQVIPEKELLWGKSHYKDEYSLLVASEYTGQDLTEGAVPVSLVKAAVPVQYRVKDLYSFLYKYGEREEETEVSDGTKVKVYEAVERLESICYRELTKFAASATLEVDDEADLEQSLLGAGRARAKRILTNNIQKAADEAELGVEIVFLGLQGIHPPVEVAADYQAVVGAVQKKQAIILDAHAERNKTLSTLAGSVEDANELYTLAAAYQAAKQQNDSEQIPKLSDELDRAFAQARGSIFSTLRESQSYAFEKATLAQATGQRFADQLQAYRAAPEIYIREQRLMVFEEALENIRKFVIVADQNDTQVFIIDVQEKLTPSLYELTGFEESTEK